MYEEVLKAFKTEGIPLFRLYDGTGKNPFDLCGVAPGGGFVGLEVKVFEREWGLSHPLPAAWFYERDHQVRWLRKVEMCGGFGLLLAVPRRGKRGGIGGGVSRLFRARPDSSEGVEWWKTNSEVLQVCSFKGWTPDGGWKGVFRAGNGY